MEGIVTVIIGTIAFFVLPDYPSTTDWLSKEEKIVAQCRLAADAGSEDTLTVGEEELPIWTGITWAVKDYRVWLFACLQMATTASISFSHFFPTLIQGLGFKTNTTVLLLTSPPYLFSFFWALGFAWDADRRQTRSPHAAISSMTAIIATVVTIVLSDQQWARYAMTFFVCSGTFGIYSTTYTWLSSTIVRPPVKRAAAIGIANTLANTASLFANYFWLDKYEPYFRQSWACVLAFQVLGLGCIMTLRHLLKRSNAEFNKLAEQVDAHDEQSISQLDEVSQRAVVNGFRYVV